MRTFDSTGEAYDACQCDVTIKTGDILLIESEEVVGIAGTWPFAVTKRTGALHSIESPPLGMDIAAAVRIAEYNGWPLYTAGEPETAITVYYRAIDGYTETGLFTNLEDATVYAHNKVGVKADLGFNYAVSFDGVGKVTVVGCALTDIWKEQKCPNSMSTSM